MKLKFTMNDHFSGLLKSQEFLLKTYSESFYFYLIIQQYGSLFCIHFKYIDSSLTFSSLQVKNLEKLYFVLILIFLDN